MNKTFIKIEVIDASSVHDFTTKDSKAIVLEYTKNGCFTALCISKEDFEKNYFEVDKDKAFEIRESLSESLKSQLQNM